MKILITLIEAFILASLSQRRTNMLKEENRKDRFFFFLTFLIIVMFVGLRTRYNDTWVYIGNYRDSAIASTLSEFYKRHYSLADEWGFRLVSSFFKSIGFDEHLYIMAFSVFSTGVTLWYLRDNASNNFGDSVYLLFVTGTMSFELAALKQVTATMIAFIATNEALKGKWFKYSLLLFVAFTFHPFVLVFLVVPFVINKKPWEIDTILLIGILFVLGIGMRFIAPLLVRFAENYTVEGILSSTVNPFRFLVSIVPVVVSFVYKDILYEDSSNKENLVAHLSICCSMFMFWTLFADPSTVGRLASYFDLAACSSLAWMIKKIYDKTGNQGLVLRIAMYAFYFAFFVYGNFYNKHFDQMYGAITIQEFFLSVRKFVSGA